VQTIARDATPPHPRAQEGSVAVAERLAASSVMIAAALSMAEPAQAAGGAYGILEGRTAALVHPAVMGTLFVGMLFSAYTGFQWRRARTIAQEIKEKKAQLPAPDAEGNTPPSPAADEVRALEEERKKILAGGFRDKHWDMGNILLAGGVGLAIEGCVNTYMRTERLFPGPHLFAGATIVALWAAAAALVPAMQKGNDAARTAHISLNVLNLALFTWQVPTGLEIVGKVFQFTQWP